MIEVLVHGAALPGPAHPGDAGIDLASAETARLAPGQRATLGTGVSIALPTGHVAFVVPRSGLAATHGITIVNSPGTIDAGYRGEIRVTLLNTDASHAYDVAVGDRIAQLIVLPIPSVRFVPVAALPGSHRGVAGFGSTGAATRDGSARAETAKHDSAVSDSAVSDSAVSDSAMHDSAINSSARDDTARDGIEREAIVTGPDRSE